ncbi:MAG: hypothetical protein LBQ66_07250 [Planctomycetaceae bacterium]|jgi:hypothetical protein|nr:hypothetical protein [Planctomycetaceae bacterium]
MESEQQPLILEILGYLNFSSGNRDPKFFVAINSLYASAFANKLASNPESNPSYSTDNSQHTKSDLTASPNSTKVRKRKKKDEPLAFSITTSDVAARNNTAAVAAANPNDPQNDSTTPTNNTSLDPSAENCLAFEVIALIESGLAELACESKTFRVDDQAGQVLNLVAKHLLPEYRKFHEDILFHQSNEILFNPFFLAKAFETVIRQGSPWTDVDRIVSDSIAELNDYIGYRPIAILEGEERHEPNQHEWVAPIPLYMAEIGTAHGKYQAIIERAMAILRKTDSQILADACFDVDKLSEVVLDPRAYDFDHPVNRKPNYHFGLWDPHIIDTKGYYRRFVVHQVTVDSILKRIEMAYLGESDESDIPQDELMYEAGAVLAGTMLMGSGVCGDSPTTYDSETSLVTLMPTIANYRDRFYEQLLNKVPAKMKERLKREEQRLYQPFGSCRQNLNKQLAKRRADQLQRMHLSRIFARMGYFDAAQKQSDIISVASTRIMTKIDCMITEVHCLIDQGDLAAAVVLLPQIEGYVRRGIACGAIVDPWTIIGFGANYSLFHSVENSIHDHRADDLINAIEDIFDLYSRLQKEAAAVGNSELQAELSDKMSDLAGWWDKYGTTTVSGLESFSGNESWESAAVVSTSLAAWHKAGTAAGDVAFWNRHVERFNSTKAYVLLAEALLDQDDPVASMALMMHWLSNSEKIPLTQGDYSFHAIAMRWMEQLWNDTDKGDDANKPKQISKKPVRVNPLSFEERWMLTKKFFDFTEANADQYWRVPTLDLERAEEEKRKKSRKKHKRPPENFEPYDERYNGQYDDDNFPNDDNEGDTIDPFDVGRGKKGEDDSDSIYSAAYENVVYRDTTDDGVDDSMLDVPPPGGFNDLDDVPLVSETDRISDRLTFIVTLSRLWKFVTERIAGICAGKNIGVNAEDGKSDVKVESVGLSSLGEQAEEISGYLDNWLGQVVLFSEGLDGLLRVVSTYVVPSPRGTADSLMEYDRHRGTKEILLDRIIWTNVDVCDAKMMLESLLGKEYWRNVKSSWRSAVLGVNSAVFSGNIKEVKRQWDSMLRVLSRETILYVPTSRGGAPWDIVRCRCIQQAIMRLMEYAPRLGLVVETFRMLETVQMMEETNTISPGAITEFDRLVETATRAITECVAISSRKWKTKTGERWSTADYVLVDYMERTVELLLSSWLSHSRQIRISPIESIVDRVHWDGIKSFIQRYGHDIFTQQNMGFGNLRAMLHQGVSNFLKSLMKIRESEGEVEMAGTLIDDLRANKIEWGVAVSQLEIIFESIAENYSEYVDYNSTTTHSDHGEKLYMLLDMLRVQIGYERISWNLKPVYWVHDAMIRTGCETAAHLWERAVARRSMNAAEEHLRQYNRLSEKYGMWLPSVHERLLERFIRPLQIDRMCGLVPKAIKQVREDVPKTAFEELYEQIENFAKEPLGVGFEVPEWLTALQDEVMSTRVDEIADSNNRDKDAFSTTPHFEQVLLTRAQFEKILETLDKRNLFRR